MRRFASVFVAGSLLMASPPVPEPVVVIRNNGPAANRVNMVILGDGYTASELTRYATDVDLVVNELFRQPPYSDYASYFNVLRVDVVSPQSGVSHPERGVVVPSALGATYNCSGIQRLICVNFSLVNTVLAASVPADARDMVLVIVNDSEYGGSGGANTVISTNAATVELALHEFGHSLGQLGDEYTTQPPPCVNTFEPSAVNVTRNTNRETIKWNSWIDANTPIPTTGSQPGVAGLFQGALFCPEGLYRPTFNSKMRSLGRPFEQINTEQHIRRFYNFVSPIDGTSPAESTLTRTCGERADFLVQPVRPSTSTLGIRWRVNDVVRGTSESFTLDTTPIGVGTHTVEVEVSDSTAAVRRDPSQLLRAVRRWTVTVTPPRTPLIFGFPERTCPTGAGSAG